MAKKITQYPASGGNPEGGSLLDISELISGNYTSKKITIDQFLAFLTANLSIGGGIQMRNNTGATIIKGTPVEMNSFYDSTTANLKKISSSSSFNKGKIYIAQGDILNGAIGNCISEGVIQFPSLFTTGENIFWNINTQTFTNDSNLDDNIFIGIILVGANWTNGKMLVSPAYSKSLVKGLPNQIPLFTAPRVVGGNSHFTWVDNVGTEVGFMFDDGSNNTTKIGVTLLNIESEGLASNSVVRLANWADNTNKGIVSFRKSRGSKSAPLKVVTNDVLGSLIFAGQADKIIDGTTTVASGMTTGEVLVRAMQNFVRNYDSWADETLATGGSQLEIYLQGTSGFANGDFTPSNTKVLTINGDGKVSLINNKLVFELDSFLRGVLTIGGQSRLTYMETDALFALQSVGLNTSININAQGDLNYPQINFGKATTSGDFPFFGQTILKISTIAHDFIEVVATEDHDITSHGSNVIFRAFKGAGYGSGQIEVLRLQYDGSLRISNAYNMPMTDGSAGQSLLTDGFGNLYFGGGGGGSLAKWLLNGHETFRGLTISNGSATISATGMSITSTGSILAQSVIGTTLPKKMIRWRNYNTTVSTGRLAGVRGTDQIFYIEGGFRFVCDFNISDTGFSQNCQQFYGLGGQIADLSYGGTSMVTLSALTNIIGVGSEINDATLHVFHNDGNGVATKINLGVNFLSNRSAGAVSNDVYSIEILNLPNSQIIHYRVTNKLNGAIATGSISSDLPTSNLGLNIFASRTMGSPSVTGSGQFDLMRFGCYTL